MRDRPAIPLHLIPALLALVACGGAEKPADSSAAATSAAPGAATSQAAATDQTPDPGGSIIQVELETDDEGNNKFEPATVSAKKGDVVRYTLKTGVHNVHFLPDSNPGAVGLPAAPSELLQLPGQTYDVKVTFGPGVYYFQCDPHALLGMMGHLEVK